MLTPIKAILSMGIVVLILMCACGGDDETSPQWYDFPAAALTLEVPDSIDADQLIEATVTGYAGCSCTHLDRVEAELVGSTWILRPIGRYVDPGSDAYCTYNCKPFGRTLSLPPPEHADWVWVVVVSTAPALIDSTYVRFQH